MKRFLRHALRGTALPLLLACIAGAQTVHVTVPASGPGKVFEGIGETSGGGAISRLLINYPEPQRSEILDYLFKPNFGASLQLLKVEIGGDGNSTEGAEPSHMHTATDENDNRGYEWWIMQEARRRNPKIKLIALAWCFPAWVKQADSAASAEYLAKFLDGARRAHGLEIDYIGLWNETPMPLSFVPLLRRTLDAHGLKTEIIADDSVKDWAVADKVQADPSLQRDVAVLATHYPSSATTIAGKAFADAPGKHLWSSEDGPWTDTWGSGGEWSRPYAETLNRNYIQGRMTATNLWCLISAYYDILEIPNAGLVRAQSPWSGGYQVMSPVWVVAHTTQFAQPGWRYMDSASDFLPGGGSYVTLTDGDHFSTVIETISAAEPQRFDLDLNDRYRGAEIAIWRTDRERSFERIANARAEGGHLQVQLEPGAVYSITNTHTQHKGSTKLTAEKGFPLPYRDNFEADSIGNTTPRYFIEENGSYETAACAGDRPGKCLAQVVTDVPIPWTSGHVKVDMATAAIIGDRHWQDYRVAADVYLDHGGYARILGRIGRVTDDGQIQGYALYLLAEGRWELRTSVHGDTILTGALPSPGSTWHRAALEFRGGTIAVELDGKRAGKQ